ncbi:MAG: hypothetical protein AB8G96_13530, partial [Phycisphaerales bacterium]
MSTLDAPTTSAPAPPQPVESPDLTIARVTGAPGFDPSLASIVDKVANGVRLSHDDGERLFATPDIWTVCSLADAVRRRMHGDVAYYNINRHVNYSNVCALSCKFCAFYRKRGEDGAYEFSVDEIVAEGKAAA